ncbi:MAG: energy-coupling factor transporter transmembrane protein EcfT [Clostridia bacterium]|nr:energy-coupling factor transporter transmembrane protein EcfT [Clostridia bacterium]
MISDITLGQFFPGFSPIHKLDPRTKIILATLFIVSVFLAANPAGFVLISIVCFTIMLISRISFRVMLKSLKPIFIILIFTAIINIFMRTGEGEPLLDFWVIVIYKEGIIRAFLMAYRVVLLILGTSVLLTYTTSPIALTDGLESLLSPLKLIKVPVHVFAMMMSIALRFIPTLIEETEKIMNAQKSRAADFSTGGLIKRIKALIPILIPLFVSSFKRAEELATAMECRCYRGDKHRTKLVKLTYKPRDFMFMLLFLVFLAALILLRILPYNYDVDNLIYKILFYRV